MQRLSTQVAIWITLCISYLSELPYGSILSCSWILDGQGVDRRQRRPVDPTRTIASSWHRPVNGAIPSAIPPATLWEIKTNTQAFVLPEMSVTNKLLPSEFDAKHPKQGPADVTDSAQLQLQQTHKHKLMMQAIHRQRKKNVIAVKCLQLSIKLIFLWHQYV